MAANRAAREPKPEPAIISPAEVARLTAIGWDVWNRQGEAQTLGNGGRLWTFSVRHVPVAGLRITCSTSFQDIRQDALAVTSPDPVRAAILVLDAAAGVGP